MVVAVAAGRMEEVVAARARRRAAVVDSIVGFVSGRGVSLVGCLRKAGGRWLREGASCLCSLRLSRQGED